jgi:hypothetical protein
VRRAALAAFAMLLAIDEAEACHRYSRWFYPRPQSCRVTALTPRSIRLPRVRINVVLPPHRIATPVSDIPLPDLANIDWGQLPDDDLRGRLLLRVILQGKERKTDE